MIYKLFIFLIFIIFTSCNTNSSSNPCDVMCDNCMGIGQCSECYENCYNSLDEE